jgi:hypothetical protein
MAHPRAHREPDRRITYHPHDDGWRAIIQFGIMVSGSIVVATKAEAIAAAYELAKKYPEAELAPLHLGCVKAWFTPDGWRYTRGEAPPYARYAHVFDDYGVTALLVGMVRVEDACEV